MAIGLCCSCLKVHEGHQEDIDALHDGFIACECGGAVCACDNCRIDATLILTHGVEVYRAMFGDKAA